MAIYQFITATEEGFGKVETDDLDQWLADNDAQITGYQRTTSIRAELAGQPKISGFHGPAWGDYAANGEPILRYEDAETNRQLSQ